MPMISYKCTSCHNCFGVLVQNAKTAEPHYACKKCGSLSKKTLSAPNSSSKIIVGAENQARAVEIYPDVIELNQERSKNGYNRGD